MTRLADLPSLVRRLGEVKQAAAQANGLFGGLTPFQVGELVRALRRATAN